MKLTKTKLKEFIREEILNEKSYKIGKIRIEDYGDEITIKSGPGRDTTDIKKTELSQVIKILNIINKK